MNAPADTQQRTTPPKRSRTVRDIFLDYLQKARKYYDEANVIQKEFTDGYQRYGSIRAAYIACSQDVRWKEAVENEKFMERLANMYSQAALLQELESQGKLTLRLLEEQRRTNELLGRILASNQ
jgi:hypothetical protein